jgi:hypothetical protein
MTQRSAGVPGPNTWATGSTVVQVWRVPPTPLAVMTVGTRHTPSASAKARLQKVLVAQVSGRTYEGVLMTLESAPKRSWNAGWLPD